MIKLIQTALELGLLQSLVVLALLLSYRMLNVCDLSTDGCFTFGAAVGAVVTAAGFPGLSLLAGMAAGGLSGLVVGLLQTVLGMDSLLAGIVVNTGLYSVIIATLGGSSLLNLNGRETVFSQMKALLSGTFLEGFETLLVSGFVALLVIVLLQYFLRTRFGLSIRATGDNRAMVESSSINPVHTTLVGLVLSNMLTGLAGTLMAHSQKSVNVEMGSGILTVALASLLIGERLLRTDSVFLKGVSCVLGAFLFRVVYMLALRLRLPAFMLKLTSAVIVAVAIVGPYLQEKRAQLRLRRQREEGPTC